MLSCLGELRCRTAFAASSVRFLAQFPEGLACCCLNAFDAVCCDVSDGCRGVIGAISSVNEAEMSF